MLKIKSTFGNTTPDSHKPQKCCCTMAKFPQVEIRSRPLSSPFFSSHFSFLSSPSICIFSFIRFPLLLEPKIFESVPFPSLCSPGSSEKCVSFSKHRGLLWNYSQIYWSRAGELSLRTLLLRSYGEESALSFPPPHKLFFPGWRNRSSGLP